MARHSSALSRRKSAWVGMAPSFPASMAERVEPVRRISRPSCRGEGGARLSGAQSARRDSGLQRPAQPPLLLLLLLPLLPLLLLLIPGLLLVSTLSFCLVWSSRCPDACNPFFC